MRRILRITPSADKTIRGNPRRYEFLLECGHTSYEPHGPYSVVRYGILAVNPDAEIMKHCYQCARGKPMSPKCPKTKLPIGVMTFGYCRDHCDDAQRLKCNKAYMKWEE